MVRTGTADNVGALARSAVTVPADTACAQLDELFRADADLRSVVVAGHDQLGLVMRPQFDRLMSGPFGFGQALWAHRPASLIADWEPTRVPAATSVASASYRLRTRAEDHRYDDLIVDMPDDQIGVVSATRLFDELATQFAVRAVRDDLTGLANRAHFLDLLAAACADTTPGADRVVVAFVDLDGMKHINDTHGHHAGDDVLIVTGRQISDALRPGEIAARFGGDEFAVLARIPQAVAPDGPAREIGHRLLLAITARDPRRPPGIQPRASVAVAVSGDIANPQSLLTEADMAMYRAKEAGGDQVELATGVGAALNPDVRYSDRSVLDAIDHGELRVYYQPIVSVADGSVASMEALVRWQHPGLGLLAPNRFLPGAIRRGHMPALDEWVLRTAAEDLASLHRRIGNGAPAQVNVNLSAATLADRFDHLVESALTHGGLEPAQLRLELPEDADLRAITTATPQLERLRELGVRLTLDDMGAGSTNLRFLSALSIHGIKIDRLFVAGMLNNPRDHAVVKLLTDLGHGLGMWVTAEGVETAAQLTELAQLGVAYAQGYHLGAPMPLPDLTHHLSAPNATVAADARDLRSPLGQWPQPWQARIVPGPATPPQRVTLGRRAEPPDLG